MVVIKPDHVEAASHKHAMDAAMFVGRKLKLPRLAHLELFIEVRKAIRSGRLPPINFMTSHRLVVRCPELFHSEPR